MITIIVRIVPVVSVDLSTSRIASRLRLVQQPLVGVAPGFQPSPLLHGLELVLHLAYLGFYFGFRAPIAPVPQPVQLLLAELSPPSMAEDFEATYNTKDESYTHIGDDGRVIC